MKLSISILLFITFSIQINAQNTVAKFKYEDAEKAFYDKKYRECITLLDETEKLLGQTAPNILHLKLLAQHKLFEENPHESYEAIESLRANCITYLNNYNISGLEEKYRDVYEIQNSIAKSPKTKYEFDEIILSIANLKAKEFERVQPVIESYLSTIGGRELLAQVKSIQKEIVIKSFGYPTIVYKDKFLQPDKSCIAAYIGNKGNKLLMKYVQNEGIYYSVDKKGKKSNHSIEEGKYLSVRYRLAFFPELYFFDDGYVLKYEGTQEQMHKIKVTYPSGKTENRYYDEQTSLLYKIELEDEGILRLLNDNTITQTTITYEDYKAVAGIKVPYKETVVSTFSDSNVYNNIHDYSSILINENLPATEFD